MTWPEGVTVDNGGTLFQCPLGNVDFDVGTLRDAGYTEKLPYVPVTISLTDWGKVANLKFEVIATPAFGEPIDTDIVFINEPPEKPTYWCSPPPPGKDIPVQHNFTQMLSFHFHYETLKGKLTFDVPVDVQIFYVTIETNSSISNFAFNETYSVGGCRGETSFNVTGSPDCIFLFKLCRCLKPNLAHICIEL